MKLYLSSYEYKDFEIPKEITHFHRMVLEDRSVLIVEVKQPLVGQKYGLLNNDITSFYLVNRVDENAFEKLDRFPIDVHILIIKENITINPSSFKELQNVAWGCLYDNEKDAIEHRIV